jgi:hypothetical protein
VSKALPVGITPLSTAVIADNHASLYGAAMKLRISIMLAQMCVALPAIACSPPTPLPELSEPEITRLTARAIQDSDVIVDAVVKHNEETIFLQSIKVWKGTYQHLYELGYSCGQTMTINSRVRVLLTKFDDSLNLWSVTEPLVDRRRKSKLFDSLLDEHIGNVRPSDFENGGLPHPPVP